jgi:tetratricopeptide (TPR) repeat protein
MGSQGEDEPFGSKFHKDEALIKAYQEARDNAKTSAVKKAATLGMATALLGTEKYKEAKKELEPLASNPSGMGDMLHSIYEGLGFAYEGLGDRDRALAQFKKLEKCEGGAYEELGLFHQARLLEAEGKADEARKLYGHVAASINKAEEMTPLLAYLQEKISGKEGVDLGPAMFKSPGPGPAGPLGGELTPEKLEELKQKLEEMKKMQDMEARAKEQAEGLAAALEAKGGEETGQEAEAGTGPEKAAKPEKATRPEKGTKPEKATPVKKPAPEKTPAEKPETGGGGEGEGGE